MGNHVTSGSNQEKTVSLRDIWKARKRIASIVSKTPLIHSHYLSERFQTSIYLKLENTHEIGAFKVRGAANKILSLSSEEQKRGVTTFSTGNHGLAVAYVAKQLGIRAVICISDRVPKAKVDAIKRYGAELKISGKSQDEAGAVCKQLQEEQGLTVIKPFDDPEVIAGQGTIGLEILEDLPSVDKAIIPLSGGGLLAGIGLALKATDSAVEIVGSTMNKSAVMVESIRAGKPVALDEQYTLADSLLGGIGLDNRYTFSMVQKYMNQAVLVSEESIAQSMSWMLRQHRMVVEGAAATTIASLSKGNVVEPNKEIVLIISGCNVDLPVLLEIAQQYKD